MRPETLLRRLVDIPSQTGNEANAVAFLQDQARADGFQVREDDEGNFLAETGTNGPLVLFVGHIDTVPGAIPVRIEDETLWGRGAVDAKGSLVAFYVAAREFQGAQDLRIRLVGAVDEEGLSRGAKAISSRPLPDAIVIGEPTGTSALAMGYKGVVRGSFEVHRERIHGAHPGKSAPDEAVEFWTLLGENLHAAASFQAIQARLETLQTSTNGLEDRVTGEFSVRVPWTQRAQSVLVEVEAWARARQVDLHIREVIEPAESGRNNRLVLAYRQALGEAGLPARFTRKTGTSDFNTMREKFPGVPILAYGPGDASLDHTPHERIAFLDLQRAIRVHRSALQRVAEFAKAGAEAAIPVRLAAPRNGNQVSIASRRRRPKTPI